MANWRQVGTSLAYVQLDMSLKVVECVRRLSRRVWRHFVRRSREISLVPSLHRASVDALISCNFVAPSRVKNKRYNLAGPLVQALAGNLVGQFEGQITFCYVSATARCCARCPAPIFDRACCALIRPAGPAIQDSTAHRPSQQKADI